MQTKFLIDHLKGRLAWFNGGVSAIGGISGLFTYFGAAAAFQAETWIEKSLAAALATASSIMIILIWRTLFASAIEETSPVERLASLIKAAGGCVAIAAASSWFMVAGFAENTADQVQLLRGTTKIERYTDDRYGHALQIRSLVPGITSLASELAKRSKMEREQGISTGVPGEGPLETELMTESDNLSALVLKIMTALKQVEAGHDEVAALIASMRVVANDNRSTTEPWVAFGESATAWRATLARMDTADIAHEIIAAMTAASRDFGAVVKLSSRPATAAKQQTAFDDYRNLIAVKARPIIERARAHLQVAKGEAPNVTRKNVAVVVLEEWDAFVAFWILGLSIDWAAPLLMLLSIHVATATTTPRQIFAAKVLNTTVEERARARLADKFEKVVGLDDGSGKTINNMLIGHHLNEDGIDSWESDDG